MGYLVGVFKYIVDLETGNHVIIHGGGCNNDDSSDYFVYEEGKNKEELLKNIIRDQEPLKPGEEETGFDMSVRFSGNLIGTRRELYNYVKYRARPSKKKVGYYLLAKNYSESYKRLSNRLETYPSYIERAIKNYNEEWPDYKYIKKLIS